MPEAVNFLEVFSESKYGRFHGSSRGSPSYRGASAANVLTRMSFTDASFVDGGMAALLVAGIETK